MCDEQRIAELEETVQELADRIVVLDGYMEINGDVINDYIDKLKDARATIADQTKLIEKLREAGEDSKMLDWLEHRFRLKPVICRESDTGRGYRVHNTDRKIDASATLRQAISKAMKQSEGE